MRNAHGYAVLFDPDIRGGVAERDTFTCNHCNRISHLKPRELPYATCKTCSEFICEPCYDRLMAGHPCKTVEQQADEIEAAIERARIVSAWF